MRRPERLDPDGREVHLWIIRLEASDDNFARSLAWLSPEESARAERFHFPRHRKAFVLGRAALRGLLASYLGTNAADVGFVYGPQGKPALAPTLKNDVSLQSQQFIDEVHQVGWSPGPQSTPTSASRSRMLPEPDQGVQRGRERPPHGDLHSALRFNASNSGDLAAFAFTAGCEIGVDIEQHRALHEFQNIARRFFSPEEAAELLELPAAEKTDAFFHCWTRKEAYIKALGGGLSIPLDSFRVTLRPGVAARMVSLDGSEDAAHGWTLHSFDPAPGFAGAIVYPDVPRLLQSVPMMGMDELLDQLASGI
jgi:4'-phosphopantetheinyl transferase